VGTAPVTPLSYEVEMSGDTATIKFHGRIVAETSHEVKELVKPMIPKVRRIVLDLSDVKFIDSSGLGALVSLKVSAASAAYCSLEMVNFSPLLKELLQTTMLAQFLGVS
jgi:anti-sigma B factor antagonist